MICTEIGLGLRCRRVLVYLFCIPNVFYRDSSLSSFIHRVHSIYNSAVTYYIILSTLYMFLNFVMRDTGLNGWFLNSNNLQLFFNSCISRMRNNFHFFSMYPPCFRDHTAYIQNAYVPTIGI